MIRERPQFHLVRVLEDGTQQDPQVVPVTSLPWDTHMDRRGAIGVGLTAAAILALIDGIDGAMPEQVAAGSSTTKTAAPRPSPKAHASRISGLVDLSASGLVVSCSEDNTVKLWSRTDGRLTRTLVGHTDDISAICAAPDGSIVAAASRDGAIRVWAQGESTPRLTIAAHAQPVRGIVLTPDGKTLASASEDRTIRLWSILDGRLIGTLEGHTNAVRSLVITPDGRMLVSGSEDRTVRSWSLQTRQSVRTFEGHVRGVGHVAVSGNRVVSGSDDGVIKVWSTEDGSSGPLLSAQAHKGPVSALAIDAQRGVIASSGGDETVKLWSLADATAKSDLVAAGPVSAMVMTGDGLLTGDRVGGLGRWALSPDRFLEYLTDPALGLSPVPNRLRAHADAITAVALHRDGKTLLSASRDKTLKAWSIPEGTLVSRLIGHTGEVTGCMLLPDDSVVSASLDKSIVVWSLGDPLPPALAPRRGARPQPAPPAVRVGRVQRRLEGHTSGVTAMVASSDGSALVSSASEPTIRTWDLPSAAPGLVLTAPAPAQRGLALSPDGHLIASVHADAIRLWMRVTGNLLAALKPGSAPMREVSIAFAPDGQVLAVADATQGLSLWTVRDGQRIATTGRPAGVRVLMYLPDGRLVGGGSDGAVSVWSAGQLVARHEASADGSTRVVTALAAGPGNLIAAGLGDGTIALWSLPAARQTGLLRGTLAATVTSMAITADGAWLIAGDSAGVITLWDLARNTPQTVLFDPTANDANTKGLTYNRLDTITGRTITYTLPCGSPIPPGAVCTCNCVPGTIAVPRPTTPTSRPGGTICTCNKICTCVPISSARWKTDIRTIDTPLELATRLRGVRYRWTADAPDGHSGADIGLIAEEVLQVLPELVALDESGCPTGIAYAKLTAVLVEALKAQQQQIADLRREIRGLVAETRR